MGKIKVRFHLGRGANYMKWQVKYPNGDTIFLSPEEHSLVLNGCTVKNQHKTAQKIFSGANKTVCAWVLCDEITIHSNTIKSVHSTSKEISYNPRVQPHWMLDGRVADNEHFSIMYSINRKLFTYEK